ncbi:MAG TPA: DUF3224 domain-containing protein [Lysobacter sp.]
MPTGTVTAASIRGGNRSVAFFQSLRHHRWSNSQPVHDRQAPMKISARFAIALIASTWLSAATTSTFAATESAMMHASGTFDVRINPQKTDNPEAQAANLSRLSIDKQFHGALESTSQGEMLATGDGEHSGAYVAIEKVTGSLQGRKGSFVLVHRAVMKGGVPGDWSVTVVPDSGTGQLAGLDGSMKITITDGQHFYDFQYTLPGS